MTRRYSRPAAGLPDPEYHGELYQDVPAKRLVAWGIDVVITVVLVAILTVMGFLIPLFFLPFLYFIVSFLYRWTAIASASATLGMRFMAIELRDAGGGRLDAGTAFLHTAGYAISIVTVPLQLISIVLMLMTERRQGLTDSVLGTAALNRRVN